MAILELKDISKSFDGLKAIDSISISVQQGKITSLIGPNGSGKTTIFNVISGFLRSDKGSVFYREKEITNFAPHKIACLGVGRLFQDIRIFPKLSLLDNVLLAKKFQLGENPFISLFFRKKMNCIEKYNLEESISWIELVGLESKKDFLAENLSYGEQKLLSIACLLAGDSNLLLLDEPTSGVHSTMLKSILKLLRQLTEQGKTIVIIEHNMMVVNEISDWVMLLNNGKLISFGLPDEIINDPVFEEIYLGV